jgi:hypothetical protein
MPPNSRYGRWLGDRRTQDLQEAFERLAGSRRIALLVVLLALLILFLLPLRP